MQGGATTSEGVRLSWLGKQETMSATGVTWGVPWPIGTLRRDEQLALQSVEGDSLPLQSWPTAYWPDGSVKWTANAAVLGSGTVNEYQVVKGVPAEVEQPLLVTETDSIIEVDTGVMVCRLNKTGSSLIREILRGDTAVCTGGRLVGYRETMAELDGNGGGTVVKRQPLVSEVTTVEIERSGPIRVVLKVTGWHVLESEHRKGESAAEYTEAIKAEAIKSNRSWLPFVVRLYLYANTDSIRLMHTFLFDGDPQEDRIKGLGITFDVPMRGPLYNRHIRLAGDTGWFAESPKGLMMSRLTDKYAELYKRQMLGERISFDEEEDAAFLALLEDSAVWDAFKLSQQSAEGYSITKRTGVGCSWLRSAVGRRAKGLLYAGGEDGGFAVGMRHFWEKAPSSLEVDHMSGDVARLTAWFWSPDAEAMDLRHYDTKTHVASAYEGAEELRATPHGVGNTSECVIWCLGATPDAAMLDVMAQQKESPPLLVCQPQHYHRTGALGVWSLQGRSTPLKAQLEDTLEQLVSFYANEIEARGWYGFWDYGDVMHSYDPIRHTWRYDIGGCAWQNTELVPNIWLWYMFLRTGDESVFRLAEAMTRHTSETDVYHIGEYAGLGSRHNVMHWGCGCKEARIGMAGLHRYYYYLTADERIGDIMDEVKDADYATLRLDPMRAYYPKDEFPTHVRSGPDWAAFCSNWLVQWERYEDTFYRDKLLRGLESLKQMPHRLLNGPVFGYEPRSGELLFMSHENYSQHLVICMGGAQVWTELANLLADPVWTDMLAEYGEFYNLSPEEKSRRTDGAIQGLDWSIPMLSSALVAFSAKQRNDPELARLAWKLLLGDNTHWHIPVPFEPQDVPLQEYVRPIREIPWMSTNTVSQWSINVIVCLDLIGELIDGGGYSDNQGKIR
jgi:hypothetical protein